MTASVGTAAGDNSSNSVQFAVVLTLVVLELLLAFGVGLACVLLSLFLLRKVYEEESEAERSPLSAKDRDSETGADLRRPLYSSTLGSVRTLSSGEENGSSELSSSHAHSWLKWLTAW